MGALDSLSQLVLKATMPGVPDFYQGTELWDLSLVDPDNRRPVDFATRTRGLQDTQASTDWDALAAAWPDGRIKLALTQRLLGLRTRFADLLAQGEYVPLEMEGRDADRVIAFARVLKRSAIIVMAGRHFAQVTDGGRRWPRAQDWDATLELDGFNITENLMAADLPPDRSHITAASIFLRLPLAILRARLTR